MPSRILPGLGLKGDWDLGEDGWKAEMDTNLIVLSALVQPRVIDVVSADPGAPANGDIYFFDETHPTNANKVAIRDEGAWIFIAAFEGMEIYSVAENKKYRFDGAVMVDVTAVGGGGNAWRLSFAPIDNEPPAASYATLDTRNNHPVLDFDAAADESAIFTDVLPADYSGAGIRIYLYWAASTAVAGDVVWNAAIERIDLSSLDIDADGFAAVKAATTTAPATSGMVVRTTINFSDGAEMDSLAAGELFRLKVTRDADNVADTMAGDAELLFALMVSQ